MKKDNILILSVSRKTLLCRWFLKASRRYGIGVLGSDLNKDAPALAILDGEVALPGLRSVSFADKLLWNIKNKNIKLIVPTRDDELIFLSKIQNRIKESGAYILCNSTEVTKRIINKELFTKFCIDELGFHNLKVVTNPDDAADSYFPLFFRGGKAQKALKLKIDNRAQLAAAFALSPDGVATTYLDGKEVSIDAYVSRGGLMLYCVPRSRDIILGGECIVSTTVESKACVDFTKLIVAKSKITGPVVIQGMLFYGKFIPFEINLRFGGASHLAFKAAYSGPELAIREYVLGEELIKTYQYKINYRLFKDFKEIYEYK
ncbi:MAG TPA: ATP-grasp domain-containing protein [Syntrophorhabdaceae bacterium]|nr:ATP-grasp domain-containing protein [Syntrophorhabdaceae bacterium]HQM80959.1 ATP-grasp domain-containing protein [Syntrophorhabdaceae bacterium]